MNMMRVMDNTGDREIPWDPTDAKSIAEASAIFDDLTRKQDYRAYSTSPIAEMKNFDASVPEVVLAPAIQQG